MAKNKGKIGEREVVALLKEWGYEARRGQQYAGGGDSPDIVHNMPFVHIEVKRTETLSLYKALEQAKEDRPSCHCPVIFHRRSQKQWVVILDAEDFLNLFAPHPRMNP